MAVFSRRFLPPMQVLLAFEAAARHQSFTAAAAELSLTQSAVSRQIRSLESLLGADLFVRERQSVRLSSAGESYAREVRAALQRVSSATLGFRANPQGGTLNLAILPTFGTRWLAPRLPKFMAQHPGVTINLTTRLAPFDFAADQLDAAIHYGLPDWPGAGLDFLMKEVVVPACSPGLRKRHRFTRVADLRRAPLLHVISRADAWERWFAAMGQPFRDAQGMLVDQFAVAAQAAISGLGVALLPRFLIETELRHGDLVLAIDRPLQTPESYYLAWPLQREHHPPLVAFRAWLRSQANLVPNG